MFHCGKFRRGAAVLLAAVLTAGLAAGCGDKPAVSSGSSQSAGLSVKTVDLKQRKIRIYQYGFRKASITDTEDGRRLMNRVAEIEKAFNCVIELPEDDDYTAVWNATMAGQPSFDIMSVAAPHLFAQPATNGIFQDLNQFKDALDFSADKWSDQTNGLYQLSGKQFACAAESEGVNSLTGNLVMYFNKRLLKQAGYNPDDLYTMQKDGTWTWSKFEEMASKVAALSSGGDTVWGCVNNASQLYNSLCVSNGLNWITKDQQGVHFSADDPKCMAAMDFLLKLRGNNVIPQEDSFNDYKMFLEGKAGFIPEYLERLQHKDGYGGMQDDFGLVMFPKPEGASSYISINDWFSGWAILTGVKEPEKVALVLNALTEPLYPDREEMQKTQNSTYMSWVRDEGSMDVFPLVKANSVISPMGFASPVDAQWKEQVGKILKGEKTSAQAIQEVKSQYTDTLEGLWTLTE